MGSDYDKDYITRILRQMQDCVEKNKYIISQNENRLENSSFINGYRLTSQRQKEILLTIKPEDFCHTRQNAKAGYEHEVLYVFCPRVRLRSFEGDEKLADVYTKFNLLTTETGERVVIISFHERNKPIQYPFR